MKKLFRRQFALYADYHRDGRNCITHYVGIPLLFLAVLIPLALWRVPLGSAEISIGSLLLVPAVIIWIALDVGVCLAMLLVIVPLALGAEWVARSVGVAGAWSIAAILFVLGWAFQIIGHALFERRKPALLDNPFHLFIGPMFVVAKILVALGFRADLATLLDGVGTGDYRGRPRAQN